MQPVNSCGTCIDASNIGFSPIQQKLIQIDTIHPVSVAIQYRSDKRPFSNSQEFAVRVMNIWNHKNRSLPQTAVLLKNRPRLTSNLKMATVTALVKLTPKIMESLQDEYTLKAIYIYVCMYVCLNKF